MHYYRTVMMMMMMMMAPPFFVGCGAYNCAILWMLSCSIILLLLLPLPLILLEWYVVCLQKTTAAMPQGSVSGAFYFFIRYGSWW